MASVEGRHQSNVEPSSAMHDSSVRKFQDPMLGRGTWGRRDVYTNLGSSFFVSRLLAHHQILSFLSKQYWLSLSLSTKLILYDSEQNSNNFPNSSSTPTAHRTECPSHSLSTIAIAQSVFLTDHRLLLQPGDQRTGEVGQRPYPHHGPVGKLSRVGARAQPEHHHHAHLVGTRHPNHGSPSRHSQVRTARGGTRPSCGRAICTPRLLSAPRKVSSLPPVTGHTVRVFLSRGYGLLCRHGTILFRIPSEAVFEAGQGLQRPNTNYHPTRVRDSLALL